MQLRYVCFVLFGVLAQAVDDVYIFDTKNDVSITESVDGLIISGVALASNPVQAEQSAIADHQGDTILLSLSKGAFAHTSMNTNAQLQVVVVPAADANLRPRLQVLLDPGHGGNDPGAMSKQGYFEKDITSEFVEFLKHELEAYPGVVVSRTRDKDVTMDKYQRLALIQEKQPDVFISIHADAHTSVEPQGLGVFLLNADMPMSIKAAETLSGAVKRSKAVDNKTWRYATSVLRGLKGVARLHNKNLKKAPLVVLRSPDVPSFLVELGFLSNPEEAERLHDNNYLQCIAKRMAATLIKTRMNDLSD